MELFAGGIGLNGFSTTYKIMQLIGLEHLKPKTGSYRYKYGKGS
jgi:hypothetical protein